MQPEDSQLYGGVCWYDVRLGQSLSQDSRIRVHINKNENVKIILARGWDEKAGDPKYILNYEILDHS